jgi:Fe-S-cluster formation regulator IscX/YfhJ
MRTYGKKIKENNGYSIVEVYDDAPDGTKQLIGYVILDPNGREIGPVTDLDEALKNLEQFDDDPDSSPSLGM